MSCSLKRLYKKLKRLFNKNQNKVLRNTDYHDLAPSNDISNGKEYLIALEWALKNDHIISRSQDLTDRVKVALFKLILRGIRV